MTFPIVFPVIRHQIGDVLPTRENLQLMLQRHPHMWDHFFPGMRLQAVLLNDMLKCRNNQFVGINDRSV
ncbi:hypothetical protein D3C73_1589120 [compost metagenome]